MDLIARKQQHYRFLKHLAVVTVAFGIALTGMLFASSSQNASQAAPSSAIDVNGLITQIEAANNDPSTAAVISLSPDATYLLDQPYGASETGLPLVSSQIEIVGNGATIERSDVSGTPSFRIFEVSANGDLTLDDVTVSNGVGLGRGGAIKSSGSLTILNSIVSDNHVEDAGIGHSQGGGIYTASGSDLLIEDSEIADNRAIVTTTSITGGEGGGVYVNTDPGSSNPAEFNLAGSHVRNNHADYEGGGISNRGVLTIDDSDISHNYAAKESGGIYGGGQVAEVLIGGSEIHDNESGGAGGGISGPRFSDIEIVNSEIYDNVAAGSGGGLFIPYDGMLDISDVVLVDNVAGDDGGGIFSAGVALGPVAEMNLERVEIRGNEAGGAGGGISSEGIVNLDRVKVAGNVASLAGGGLYSDPTIPYSDALEISDSIIRGNKSNARGGGLYSDNGGLMLQRSTVDDNTSSGAGGGIFANWGTSVEVLESTIGNNLSGFGGGGIAVVNYHADETHLEVTNSTIYGNESAGGAGGGVMLGAWTEATLTNVTIVENTNAEDGGGGISVSGAFAAGGAQLELANSIVAQNTASGSGADSNDIRVRANSSAHLTDGGHNLIGDGTGINPTAGSSDDIVDGVNGNIVGTATNPVDPVLGPLQNNGGITETRALLAGSPAIEAGGDANAPGVDQRGLSRPQGSQSDIGAYEKEAASPDPYQQVQALNDTIEEMDILRDRQLTSTLDNVSHHLGAERLRQACRGLDRFAAHADRQSNQPRGIGDAEAMLLIEGSREIQDQLDC